MRRDGRQACWHPVGCVCTCGGSGNRVEQRVRSPVRPCAGACPRRSMPIRENGAAWGEGISVDLAWHVVTRYCRSVGLEHVAPHDLRQAVPQQRRRAGTDSVPAWPCLGTLSRPVGQTINRLCPANPRQNVPGLRWGSRVKWAGRGIPTGVKMRQSEDATCLPQPLPEFQTPTPGCGICTGRLQKKPSQGKPSSRL